MSQFRKGKKESGILLYQDIVIVLKLRESCWEAECKDFATIWRAGNLFWASEMRKRYWQGTVPMRLVVSPSTNDVNQRACGTHVMIEIGVMRGSPSGNLRRIFLLTLKFLGTFLKTNSLIWECQLHDESCHMSPRIIGEPHGTPGNIAAILLDAVRRDRWPCKTNSRDNSLMIAYRYQHSFRRALLRIRVLLPRGKSITLRSVSPRPRIKFWITIVLGSIVTNIEVKRGSIWYYDLKARRYWFNEAHKKVLRI